VAQCVILVGGLGTRLGALTANRPKPLLPVAGRPFVHYLLWHARRFGFSKALLLAGYRAEVLAEELQTLALPGLELDVVTESEPLGTGGAICASLDALDDQFLLMNGDSLFDFNWLSLTGPLAADPHCAVVMSLRAVPDASRFGVAEVEDGRVTAFHERGGTSGGLINGGVYLVRREGLEGLRSSRSFERDILPALAAEGRVRGLAMDGFFLDIGVPDSYASAQTEVPDSLRRGALFVDRSWALADSAGGPRWTAAALHAVRMANDRGLYVFMTGTDPADTAHQAWRDAVQAPLRAAGAHIDDFATSPAVARRDWAIDLHASLAITSDADAADCGVRTIRPDDESPFAAVARASGRD
jgi:D-glycero-D-manno-heptose 1,7-bisphosphate phosphatase